MIYETDTDLTYIYNGSAWQQVSGGTSVGNSGLVYVAGGSLSLTTTPINITGVFSSTYKNYKLMMYISDRSTTNRFDMKYIVGTTPTSVNYYSGGIGSEYGANTVAYFQRSNNDPNFYFDSGSTGTQSSYSFDIFSPNVANRTIYTGNVFNYQNGVGYSVGGTQTSTNQFTGFQLFANTGTVTIQYQVFGYRD
jgi:hypothetical protein